MERWTPAVAMDMDAQCLFDDPEAGFIRCDERVLPGTQGLPFVLARYQLSRYSSAQFIRHGIEFPLNIRNSVNKRQAEFMAGRLCAKLALEAHGHWNVNIAAGTHRQPLWPAGLVGSITHNSDYAAALVCARTTQLGVGIDIEHRVDDNARHALHDLVLMPAEASLLRSKAGIVDFNWLLTIVFSAKESFYKASFNQVGDYFGFDAVRVADIDIPNGSIDMVCTRTLSTGLRQGQLSLAHFAFLDTSSILTTVRL
jgi:enterobactin synthetase component D